MLCIGFDIFKDFYYINFIFKGSDKTFWAYRVFECQASFTITDSGFILHQGFNGKHMNKCVTETSEIESF